MLVGVVLVLVGCDERTQCMLQGRVEGPYIRGTTRGLRYGGWSARQSRRPSRSDRRENKTCDGRLRELVAVSALIRTRVRRCCVVFPPIP